MERTLSDLKLALRSLAKNPVLVLVVVGSLGLGMGGVTTVYSVINTLLLRPLPAPRPHELAMLYTSESSGERFGGTSYPDYVDLRDRNPLFESLAAYTVVPMSVTVQGKSQRVLGGLVSGNYLPMMAARAAVGRSLLPSDDAPSAPPALVLSHGFWTRRFGADPAVVGGTLRINGHLFQVAGVLQPEFRGAIMGVTPDVLAPLASAAITNPGRDQLDQRGHRWLFVLGRLAPGRGLEEAQARVNAIGRGLALEHPESDSARVYSLVPEAQGRLHPKIRGPLIAFVSLLLVVVALVLLVACANVAGLMLARAATRRREVGVRLALGATRGRVVRQFLTESVLLALLGGAFGWMLAAWGTDLLLAFHPPLPIDVSLDLRPDARVLGFAVALALATGGILGLLPALEATRGDPSPAIHEGADGGRRGSRMRSVLVVTQVAVSLLLLVGAGLMLRGLARASRLAPGFDVDHTVSMSFDLRLAGYDEARGRAFYRTLLERVRALPGVAGAAYDEQLPLGFGSQTSGVAIEGYTPPGGHTPEVDSDVVSAGYFSTLRIPLLAGRDFGPSDREGGHLVAIVNQAFARRYWPGMNPLGRHIDLDPSAHTLPLEVVGVVGDVKVRQLAEPPRPFFYQPTEQAYSQGVSLVVRAERDPRSLLPVVRDAVRAIDPDLPVFDVKTMGEHLGITLYPARLASTMMGTLGVLALLLAALGLYGVIAFGVAQRTREIGVRMALGARPADVLGLVIAQGMRLAGLGLAIGLVLALAGTRLVASLLFGVSPTDPATIAGIALLLVSVTAFASWLPARRAASVDPMLALRHE